MRLRTAALFALVAALAVGANAYPGAPEDKPAAAQDKANAAMPSSQATGSGQYVGASTCQGCHDELYKGFEASPHWMTTQETKVVGSFRWDQVAQDGIEESDSRGQKSATQQHLDKTSTGRRRR